MPATLEPRALPTDRFVLAEGPQWDAGTGTISWVDVEAGLLVVARPLPDAGVEVLRTHDLGERVGFATRFGDAKFVVALERRLAVIDALGDITTSRELVPPGRRFNDGVVDPLGRLLVGTLTLDESQPGEGNQLLRLEHDGTVLVIDDDLRLSNGLGFSPAGDVLYHVDSQRSTIFARSYDAATGEIGARHALVELADAIPDGLAVDAAGDLWVGLWDRSGVRRFGADGTVHGDVPLPVPHVTSVAFMGSALDHLLVTTASRDLDADALHAAPDAGRVFSIDLSGLGVTGAPATRWRPVPLPV